MFYSLSFLSGFPGLNLWYLFPLHSVVTGIYAQFLFCFIENYFISFCLILILSSWLPVGGSYFYMA